MRSDGSSSSPTPARLDPGEAALIELVNSAYTADDLQGPLAQAGVDPGLSRALIRHRGLIGSFRTIEDLVHVEGLDATGVGALIDAFGQPTFDAEAETLEYVVWTHGSTLAVETPERFGQVSRRQTGLRIHSLDVARGEPFTDGRSNVMAAIATPAYTSGKRFHVRSVLITMDSYPGRFDVLGRPVAAPTDASVWDGPQKMANTEIGSSEGDRYVRMPIASSHQVRTGIAVSLDVTVRTVPEGIPAFWLEINAVGVEFVTRSGGVVAPVDDH